MPWCAAITDEHEAEHTTRAGKRHLIGAMSLSTQSLSGGALHPRCTMQAKCHQVERVFFEWLLLLKRLTSTGMEIPLTHLTDILRQHHQATYLVFCLEERPQKTHLNKMTFDYAVLQGCPPGTEQRQFYLGQTVLLVDIFWRGCYQCEHSFHLHFLVKHNTYTQKRKNRRGHGHLQSNIMPTEKVF